MALNLEKLIEAVRGYPVLWNSGIIEYRDRTKKDNAWAAVAKASSCSMDAAKKGWKNLRDKYVRERRQEYESSRSGGAADAIYVSKWVYFKALAFLRDTIKHRATISNFDDQFASGVSLDTTGIESQDLATGIDSDPDATFGGGDLDDVAGETNEESGNVDDDLREMTEEDVAELRRQRQKSLGRVMGSAASAGEEPDFALLPKTKKKRASAGSFAEDPIGLGLLQAATAIANKPQAPLPQTTPQAQIDGFALEVSERLANLQPKVRSACKLKILQILHDAEFADDL